MGVPYVSLSGSTVIGRTGAAILSSVGLSDMVVKSTDEYVQTALRYANDIKLLELAKETISNNINETGFFNPSVMAKELYSDFHKMWNKYLNSH